MDPNVTLANLRLVAVLVQQALDAGNAPDADQVAELVELTQALDGWLSKGGFRPQDWTV